MSFSSFSFCIVYPWGCSSCVSLRGKNQFPFTLFALPEQACWFLNFHVLSSDDYKNSKPAKLLGVYGIIIPIFFTHFTFMSLVILKLDERQWPLLQAFGYENHICLKIQGIFQQADSIFHSQGHSNPLAITKYLYRSIYSEHYWVPESFLFKISTLFWVVKW